MTDDPEVEQPGGASWILVGVAWVAVGVPLLWGIWTTLEKAVVLFR
jgi:hypothetical protein